MMRRDYSSVKSVAIAVTVCMMESLQMCPVRGESRIIPHAASATLTAGAPCRVAGETVTLFLSLRVRTEIDARCYCAFMSPSGALLFFNHDQDALFQGDANDRESWTPYSFEPIRIPTGVIVERLGVCRRAFAEPGRYTGYFLLFDAGSGRRESELVTTSFRVFLHRISLMERTVHVGDYYDPYMATWEVPQPEGITVEIPFQFREFTENEAVLQAAFFATYYGDNPVYLNKKQIGTIPGLMNATVWRWGSGSLPEGSLLAGKNILSFGSACNSLGHYDNYLVKEAALYYDEAGKGL